MAVVVIKILKITFIEFMSHKKHQYVIPLLNQEFEKARSQKLQMLTQGKLLPHLISGI